MSKKEIIWTVIGVGIFVLLLLPQIKCNVTDVKPQVDLIEQRRHEERKEVDKRISDIENKIRIFEINDSISSIKEKETNVRIKQIPVYVDRLTDDELYNGISTFK